MRRTMFTGLGVLALAACVTTVAGVSFGTDAGEYPRDGECDDPRFAGGGMADALDARNVMRDATDCSRLYQASKIRLARTREQSSPAECAKIDFGNNSSEWARDGECDDPRFAGPGTDEILLVSDAKSDAQDCRQLCRAGSVWLK